MYSRVYGIRPDLRYQYVVFEDDEKGDLIAHQNADEWIGDYFKSYYATGGFQPGDVVCSVYKTYPVYQLIKVFRTVVWLRPYDEKKHKAYGEVQKNVPYDSIVKA